MIFQGEVVKGSGCRRLCAIFAAAMTFFALGAGSAMAGDPADPGTIQTFTEGTGANARPYIVYTPTTYDAGRPAPLLVMTHGCQTTAEQQMKANLYNRVAEREGFVVMYPDVDEALVNMPGPLRRCWRFYDSGSWHRDQGDAAAIAGMTRATMKRVNIDPERVYLMGMSAGGFMTSIMAAAYPDLYAAVGINAAGAYGDAVCLGVPSPIPVAVTAQNARTEMGANARIVPRLVMGGDKDQGIPPACADKALEQGLRTNNLVIGDSQTSPISLTPSSVREESNPSPGGYASTVSEFTDPDGCLVGERWLIHGMNHFWPGGSSDPELKNFTDPKGPNGAEISWKFFSRFKLTDTSMPCAEKNPEVVPEPDPDPDPLPSACSRRKLTYKLPRRTVAAKVKVNGKPVKVTRKGRRIKVTLPSTRRSRTVVVVKSRTKGGPWKKRKHSYKGCGPKRRR